MSLSKMRKFGKITVLNESGAKGPSLPITERNLVFGSDPDDADVRINRSSVKPVHSQLTVNEVEGNKYEFCLTNLAGDAGDWEPVEVNGRSIGAKQTVKLNSNDKISIGDRHFQFVEEIKRKPIPPRRISFGATSPLSNAQHQRCSDIGKEQPSPLTEHGAGGTEMSPPDGGLAYVPAANPKGSASTHHRSEPRRPMEVLGMVPDSPSSPGVFDQLFGASATPSSTKSVVVDSSSSAATQSEVQSMSISSSEHSTTVSDGTTPSQGDVQVTPPVFSVKDEPMDVVDESASFYEAMGLEKEDSVEHNTPESTPVTPDDDPKLSTDGTEHKSTDAIAEFTDGKSEWTSFLVSPTSESSAQPRTVNEASSVFCEEAPKVIDRSIAAKQSPSDLIAFDSPPVEKGQKGLSAKHSPSDLISFDSPPVAKEQKGLRVDISLNASSNSEEQAEDLVAAFERSYGPIAEPPSPKSATKLRSSYVPRTHLRRERLVSYEGVSFENAEETGNGNLSSATQASAFDFDALTADETPQKDQSCSMKLQFDDDENGGEIEPLNSPSISPFVHQNAETLGGLEVSASSPMISVDVNASTPSRYDLKPNGSLLKKSVLRRILKTGGEPLTPAGGSSTKSVAFSPTVDVTPIPAEGRGSSWREYAESEKRRASERQQKRTTSSVEKKSSPLNISVANQSQSSFGEEVSSEQNTPGSISNADQKHSSPMTPAGSWKLLSDRPEQTTTDATADLSSGTNEQTSSVMSPAVESPTEQQTANEASPVVSQESLEAHDESNAIEHSLDLISFDSPSVEPSKDAEGMNAEMSSNASSNEEQKSEENIEKTFEQVPIVELPPPESATSKRRRSYLPSGELKRTRLVSCDDMSSDNDSQEIEDADLSSGAIQTNPCDSDASALDETPHTEEPSCLIAPKFEDGQEENGDEPEIAQKDASVLQQTAATQGSPRSSASGSSSPVISGDVDTSTSSPLDSKLKGGLQKRSLLRRPLSSDSESSTPIGTRSVVFSPAVDVTTPIPIKLLVKLQGRKTNLQLAEGLLQRRTSERMRKQKESRQKTWLQENTSVEQDAAGVKQSCSSPEKPATRQQDPVVAEPLKQQKTRRGRRTKPPVAADGVVVQSKPTASPRRTRSVAVKKVTARKDAKLNSKQASQTTMKKPKVTANPVKLKRTRKVAVKKAQEGKLAKLRQEQVPQTTPAVAVLPEASTQSGASHTRLKRGASPQKAPTIAVVKIAQPVAQEAATADDATQLTKPKQAKLKKTNQNLSKKTSAATVIKPNRKSVVAANVLESRRGGRAKKKTEGSVELDHEQTAPPPMKTRKMAATDATSRPKQVQFTLPPDDTAAEPIAPRYCTRSRTKGK